MLAQLLLGILLFQETPNAPASSQSPASTVSQASSGDVSGRSEAHEAEQPELLKVKRIFVDSFGDDAISKQMQSMVIAALVASKRFKVTENRERADAVLKGVALEKTSQEIHAYGESTAVGGANGGHSSHVSGSVINGNGSISGSSSGGFSAHNAATSDSSLNTETVNEARLAIRLVNPDGDVIWTTTQESKGAKYKGSSADAADKCVKQLLRDVEKLQPIQAVQEPAEKTN